ncbi:hypothetical protein MRB53_006305 [Persea americana]|uniref:Uncharacterized protein n=1 Tax=Persea americana TaxID=3435 RepID=A0ACC2MFS3_PERAE|nr:hypothetical protein MRB53_006305 [Persea americana]
MVKAHLEENGIDKTYTGWVFHGEDFEEMSEDEDDDGDAGVEQRCDGLQEMLADVCAGRYEMDINVENIPPGEASSSHGPSAADEDPQPSDAMSNDLDPQPFDAMLNDLHLPLYSRFMTTGRQTSAHLRDASIFDSTIELESHIQGTSMSSVASTSTRKGRGRSKNISLTRHIKDTDQKLRIEIPKGLSRPVGKYAKRLKTEVGIICRTYAPPACSTWPAVKQEQRQIFYDRILEKFDIDLHDSRLKKAVNSYLALTFKNYRNRLHSHYKRFGNHEVASQKPYEGVSQEDWEMCCNRFCSDDFQRDAPIGRIELWKKTHYSLEKDRSTLECQLLYEKMIRLQSQSTEKYSTPLTDDEICKRVLGTRPGYVRGLGHGVVAPPSSSTGLHNDHGWKNLLIGPRQLKDKLKS